MDKGVWGHSDLEVKLGRLLNFSLLWGIGFVSDKTSAAAFEMMGCLFERVTVTDLFGFAGGGHFSYFVQERLDLTLEIFE